MNIISVGAFFVALAIAVALLAGLLQIFGVDIGKMVRAINKMPNKKHRILMQLISIISLIAVLCGSVCAAYITTPMIQETFPYEKETQPEKATSESSVDSSIPHPEKLIIIPSTLLLLSADDVRGSTFLSLKKAIQKLIYQLRKCSKHDILTQMDGIASPLLEGDLLTRYRKFTDNPDPWEGANSALGLSDAFTNFASDNESTLSKYDYANYRFLAAELALFALVSADDLETSPLALKAWNRVWTCFLQIALIPDISETERHIFYISAASGTYIRIGLSYDGENDKNRRASDIADCRSLCIRLMDISEGQSMDAAMAFALVSNELTILAEKEGLPPQRSQEVYENETKHINDFLRKAS